jgi:hypothetical protein
MNKTNKQPPVDPPKYILDELVKYENFKLQSALTSNTKSIIKMINNRKAR